jgi:hypothetical protein
MSTVTVMTQWNVATTEMREITALGREAKGLYERYGAEEFSLNVIETGKDVNQLVEIVIYLNWDAFGKCMAQIVKDERYNKLMADICDVADLTNRVILNGIPLD